MIGVVLSNYSQKKSIKYFMDLKHDLYIIPVDEGNIIYSPLRRGLFWANDQSTKIVERYLSNTIDESDYANKTYQYLDILSKAEVFVPKQETTPTKSRVVVILSQICNLACTYCYAQEARAKEVLSKDKLKIVYDFILADNNKQKHVSFIGGGEPFVTWDTIEWSVNYINQHKSMEDDVSFSITTNATLFNDHIIAICKENNIRIGVSFEIIKHIQDNQRPFSKLDKSTFDVIHSNVQRLIDNGISFGIRSTITKLNVTLMPKMVNFVAENYPILKSLHFEPVTDPAQNDAEFYSNYIDYFFQARAIGRERGIDVFNSITTSVSRLSERFCAGETCVTPTGSIVACHRVASEKNQGYELYNFGQVDETSVFLDMEKYQSYLNFATKKTSQCKECFAYWHCAGICSMERTIFSNEQLQIKCKFIKETVKRILMETVVSPKDNSINLD